MLYLCRQPQGPSASSTAVTVALPSCMAFANCCHSTTTSTSATTHARPTDHDRSTSSMSSHGKPYRNSSRWDAISSSSDATRPPLRPCAPSNKTTSHNGTPTGACSASSGPPPRSSDTSHVTTTSDCSPRKAPSKARATTWRSPSSGPTSRSQDRPAPSGCLSSSTTRPTPPAPTTSSRSASTNSCRKTRTSTPSSSDAHTSHCSCRRS